MEVVAQQGMEGWRRKERSPGSQAGRQAGEDRGTGLIYLVE